MVLHDFKRFEEVMNKMFEEFWGESIGRKFFLSQGGAIGRYETPFINIRKPCIDLIDKDKELIAIVEIPGLEKGDIKINFIEDILEISANTKQEEEKREKDYIYKERKSGSYYCSVHIPIPIDSENAKAFYNNGILEIRMPKVEIKKKIQLNIQ